MGFKQPENVPVGENSYRLTEDYIYEISSFLRVLVLSGFYWDGASVPKAFYWFLRRDGRIRAASLIHDAIYRNSPYLVLEAKSRALWVRGDRPINRETADKIFYNLMIEAGIPKWRADIAYRCVRIFGKKHWNGLPELA